MKRKFTKLMAALALLVGLAIPMGVWAAEGDVHDMGITQSTLLNNNAAIPSINIDAQSYSVNKVTINWRYNKAIENPVTIEVLVGENSWGTQTITGNTTADAVFEGESTIGAIVINFTNNTGDGTGHGTFYVNSVKLTEGESSGPAPTTYTVTFDAGDGTFVGNTDFPNASNTVEAGTYTLPSATPAEGYTFDGWTLGTNTYQGGADYTVSGDASFVASYTQNGGGSTTTVMYDFSTTNNFLTEYPGTTHPGTGNTNNLDTFYYSNGDAFTASGTNRYFNSGYFMLGKTGATLQLPAFDFDVEKIVITGRENASAAVVQNIYVGDQAVSTATTGATGENTYYIASGYQTAGTVYTLKVTSNHNTQITKIEVFRKLETSVSIPTFTPAAGTYTEAQSVTITCETEGSTIYYTLDGSTPSSESTQFADPISVNATTTIKAIAVKGENTSDVASATYTIVSIEHAGTEADPYTVADARNAIDVNTGVTGVYATGIVSAIPTEWSTQYNNITFNIVDEEGDEDFLQAFRCVSTTNADASTVAVGDIVVVYGDLTKYGSTYEFGSGCQLVSLVHPQSTEPSITVTPILVEVDAEAHDGNLSISFENLNIADEDNFDVVFYAADGTTIADYSEWLDAEVVYENEAYAVYYTIQSNAGEARHAYLKVYVLDEDAVELESDLVTINQAAYVAPAEPGTWVLTSLADLTEDDIFVIVGTYEDAEHDSYAMSNDNGTSAPNAVEVTVVDGTLSGEPTANIQWGLGITDDGYIFYPNGNTETWLYCINTNNGVKVGTGDAKHFTLDDEFEGYLTTTETSDQRYIGIYNTQDWRCYKANQGEFPNNNIAGQSFAFYKRTVEPESYPLTINGYTDDNAKTGYNLIASPVTVNIADVEGMTEGDFDLYYYDDTQELEWINYELTSNNFTQLVPGKGYLYAKKATTETPNYEFTLTGTPYTGTGEIDIIAGWNLVGNPYGVEAEISEDYYALDQDSEELIPTTAETHVAAMQGVFVHADNDDTVIFEAVETPSNGKGQNIALNVMKNRGNVIDRAIVRFGEGRQLPKFQLNPNSTKLYIPQGNKDYAIVRSANEAEMPVSFKASENGTYTLAVEAENVEMNYLHLIDNMTGMDVDLLQTPNYTFEAKTSDYASRFRLVFSANGTTDNEVETFAYFNGSNWTVNNLGEATLQIVDVTGRTVSCETINGNATISLNQTPGVYMFRLVSGNGVKVQKVVVK